MTLLPTWLLTTLTASFLLLGGTVTGASVLSAGLTLGGIWFIRKAPVSQTDRIALGGLVVVTVMNALVAPNGLIALAHGGWLITLLGFSVLTTYAYRQRPDTQAAGHLVWFGLLVLALVWGHRLVDAHTSLGIFVPHATHTYAALPIINPNHLAALLVVILPFTVKTTNQRLSTLFAVATMITLWVYATWSSLLVGALVLAFIHRARHRRITGVVIIIGVLCVASVIGLYPWHNSLRLSQLADAWPLFLDNPSFGVGLGHFAEAFAPYRTDTLFRTLSHLHNDPIELIIEIGQLGSALLVICLWPMAKRMPPTQRLSLLAVAALSLVEFPLHLPVVALTIAFIVGSAQQTTAKTEHQGPWLLIAVAAALVLMGHQAFIAHAVTKNDVQRLAVWQSNHPSLLVNAAQTAITNGDLDTADEATSQLFDSHGHVSKWAHIAGELWEQTGQTDQAIHALERAVHQSPSDKRHRFLLGTLHYAAGHVSESLAATHDGICRDGNSDDLAHALSQHPLPVYWLNTVETCQPSLLFALARQLQYSDPFLALAAMQLSPHPNRTLHAQLLARTGDVDGAIEHLTTPATNTLVHRTALVQILVTDKQYEAALQTALPALLSGTAGSGLLMLSARSYLALGQPTECSKILNRPQSRVKLADTRGVEALRDTCARQ